MAHTINSLKEAAESRKAAAVRRGRDLVGGREDEGRMLSRADRAQLDDIDRTVRAAQQDIERLQVLEAEEAEAERRYAEVYDVARSVGPCGFGDTRVPPLFADARTAQELHAAVLGGTSKRAAILTATSGADQLAVQVVNNARAERRIAVAAGLSAESVAGVTRVEFPVFGAGDAEISTEGSAKTEYSNITPGEAIPQMIAIWSDVSRQVLLTQTNFESKLRNVLSAKVARREDQLMVDTALATTGIQTLDMAAPDPDAILEGAGMVAAGDVGSEPNLAIVNPADLPALVGSNVGAGGSASPTFGQFLPTVHGLRLYPSSAIAAGEVLLGAWPVASHYVIGMGPEFLVDAVSQVKSNLVTLLLETAVCLAVDEPSGFVHLRPGA